MTISGTLWEIEALHTAREHRKTISEAYDLVILDWLAKGDTRPFADWIMRGHRPSQNVLLALAVMMNRSHDRKFDPAALRATALCELAQLFPLSLSVTGKGKRCADQANVVRDKQIALEVARAMARGSTEDAAFEKVRCWLAEGVGCHMSGDNVKKAYNKYKSMVYVTNSR